MTETPETVLIIGAGGSCPYGLPTGRQLLADVMNALQTTSSNARTALEGQGYRDGDFENLRFSIDRREARTIDEYLRTAPPRLQRIGKFLIAYILLDRECNMASLPANSFQRDWYRTLYRRWAAATPEARQRLAVVTFNYDRVLEYQFVSRIVADTIHADKTEVDPSAFPPFALVHAHGMLGPVRAHRDWCIPHFREGVTTGKIREAADGISIVAEPAADPAFVRARAFIAGARRLLFVGFGFDPTNLQRLGFGDGGLAEEACPKSIIATCFDPTEVDKEAVARAIPRSIHWADETDGLGLLEWLGDPFAKC